MATTTATISISSDIMSNPIRINSTMTMKKLQSCTGLEETTGLRTKKFTATTETVVIEEDQFTNTKASKVYMRNTSSSKAHYFYVAKHASEAASDTADVNITVASSTTDAVILEYMVFAE